MPYRFKSGSWRPARLRWIDHALLMIGLIIISFLRGIDYLIGNDTWGARDFMIAAAPEWVWGGGFLLGGAILAYGVTTARHAVVYIGHGWLATAYGLNSLALIIASGPDYALGLVAITVANIILISRAAHWLVQKHKNGNLAFLLTMAGVGLFAAAIYFSNSFDGMRGGGAVGFVALLHFMHMLRTGGRPLRVDEEHTTSERVVGGGDER